MATYIIGERKWGGSTDEKGYRTYLLTMRVASTDGSDGPANVLNTPGLPLPGAVWAYFGDVDPWVYCRRNVSLRGVQPDEGKPIAQWDVDFTFSNKPLEDNKCQDQKIDDPLLIPPEISGSFSKYTEEAVKDRFGRLINSSSHEQIRGPHNEWDAHRPVIKIKQNVPQLQLPLLNFLNDCTNDAPLWGCPTGWIKLTVEDWEEKYYGQCYKYYTRSLCFELKKNGWARDLLDMGTKVLHGHWGTGSGSGCQIGIVTGLGTGCTVAIIVSSNSGGQVADVALVAGGSGYPVSAQISLKLVLGGGVGGVVTATTDASGVVIDVDNPPANSGLQYADGTATTSFNENPGAITGAVISSGGSAYPVSSSFNLKLISGKGFGGVVTVKTNGSGVVASVSAIAKAGQGYADGIATTNTSPEWMLDNIDGLPPNPDNPAHFDRFKDRQGENTNVILDGGGCPAATAAQAGKMHVECYSPGNFLLLGIPLLIGP